MAGPNLFATALVAVIGGTAAHGTTAVEGKVYPPTALQVRGCGPYDKLRDMLAERFGEEPASSGVADNGFLLQLFASNAADTWTMVNVSPQGNACVVAVGRNWQDLLDRVQGRPA